MARILTLKYDGSCIDCERDIPAGETGRWIGRGRITCAPGDPDGCKADADSEPQPQRNGSQDKPRNGTTYRLTAPAGVPSISNGSTWADSRVDLSHDDDQNGRGHEREDSARVAGAVEGTIGPRAAAENLERALREAVEALDAVSLANFVAYASATLTSKLLK